MIRPTPEQRAEMAAFVDAKQPGLLDELGIPREEPKPHACNIPVRAAMLVREAIAERGIIG